MKDKDGLLTNEELDSLVASLNILSPVPRKRTCLEKVCSWAATYFIQASYYLPRGMIQSISIIGKSFYDQQFEKKEIVEHIFDFDGKDRPEHDAEVKSALGKINPITFLNIFSIIMGNIEAERLSAMYICRVDFDTAKNITAYFYRPFFYWELFKSRLNRR